MSGKRLKEPGNSDRPPAPEGDIVFVGAGNMGGAIARRLAAQGAGPRLHLVDPSPNSALVDELTPSGASFHARPDALPGKPPALIVLAVKPQIMSQVAPGWRQYARSSLFLSVAAGISLASLDAWLGNPAALVRSMPNLPALVGKGMTAAVAKPGTPDSAKAIAETTLRAVGDLVWLDDERALDAVTAISGSGPAYVFHLAECLAAAARAEGLPPGIAEILARRTIEGAGELLAQRAETPAALRQAVTSPGGTTEAALKVLMGDDRLQTLIREAVRAAASRSRELSGQSEKGE